VVRRIPSNAPRTWLFGFGFRPGFRLIMLFPLY
jgi:hypothetical protein